MENEDMIRTEMEETRGKLSDKLDTLEKKLVESVEDATAVVNTVKDTVHDSMATVKESVHDTVANVKESVNDTVDSVKDFVNIEKQWEQHPWLLAGGAVACGYVLATVLSSPRRSEPRVASAYQSPVPFNVRPQPPEPAQAAKAAGANWLSAFEPELNTLKSLALGATFGTIRELIATQVPPAAAPMVRSMLDGLTKKMGGELIVPESSNEPTTDSMTTSPVSTSYDQPAVGAGVETKTRRW